MSYSLHVHCLYSFSFSVISIDAFANPLSLFDKMSIFLYCMTDVLIRVPIALFSFLPSDISIQLIREVWKTSGVVDREYKSRCLERNAFECLQGFDRLIDLSWLGVVLGEGSAGCFSDCLDAVARCELGGV
jgi:hypothetical protein